MRDIIILSEQDLINIANIIREKYQITDPIRFFEMAMKILNIGKLEDSETVSFGIDAEFEEKYEITSDRLNEIAVEAQRFARTSEALNPAQILQSLKDAVDDNPFIEGCVPEVHSETATKIKPYCFYGDETLASFSAPNVTSIGVGAFNGCSNLKSISIPQVTSIPNDEFRGCSSLANVDMPLITSIGTYGFYQSGVKDVNFPELTSLGTYAFAECESLESFVAPKVTTIPASAFFNSGLKEIDFSEITTINTTSNYGTFQGTKLVDITLPKVTTIGVSCFQSANDLESVNAPLVTSVSSNAFRYCESLQSVDLPACTSIGDYAFSGSNIEEVGEGKINLPLIKTISGRCFESCENLKVVHFPEVTATSQYSFLNCTALIKCEFDKKVSITYDTFRNCTALEALILRGDTMSTFETLSVNHSFANSGISKGTAYIYVPRALLETYTTNSRWKAYINQFRAIEDYPDVCDGKEVIREYIFDTSKESEYTFDKNYVDSNDGYSLRTEYDCEFAEEEIDSGKMVVIDIDIDVNGIVGIEGAVIE